MANLLYLAAAVVLSIVVSVIIVVRNRKPTSMEAGIEAFNRELRALAPDKRPNVSSVRGGPRGRSVEQHAGRVARGDGPDKRSGATPG